MKQLLTAFLLAMSLTASAAAHHKSRKLSSWGILPANYSGITPFGGNMYAIVSDKEMLDGFYVWQIMQDPLTGQVMQVTDHGFRGQVPLDTTADGISLRDEEDIVFCPQRHSFFVCGESYQDIIEMDMNGQRTGYELPVPNHLRTIYPNYGFEALAYDSVRQTFYTTTENCLPADGIASSPLNHTAVKLRLQAFKPQHAEQAPIGDSSTSELTELQAASAISQTSGYQVAEEFIYLLDIPRASRIARSHTHGVVAMTALGDGKLAVLEREAFVTQAFTGSWVYNKLYIVDTNVPEGSELQKQFVTQWDTHIKLVDYSWANYEGMCLGQPLPDGRQTLILISDSQQGYGIGPVHLQDYIRVIVL